MHVRQPYVDRPPVHEVPQEVHDLKRLIDCANAPIFGINASSVRQRHLCSLPGLSFSGYVAQNDLMPRTAQNSNSGPLMLELIVLTH